MRFITAKTSRVLLIAAACCTTALIVGYPAEKPKFGAINRERLLRADKEPGEWLTTGRDFGHTHHSALTDINQQTASRVGFAWEYQTGTTRGMEATPIVVDGVMYTSGPTGRVYALHADTGKEIWKFDPQSDGQVNRWACCDEVNRGVAVWDGMVYVAALDGRMFGLDAGTGKVIWTADTVVDHNKGYTSTGRPEVAGNVVVIGNGGADYDARGYASAYDIKTGKLKWRFFMVPRDPKLGPQENKDVEQIALPTWDPNSRWDVGGGGTPWGPMVYDPELNLLYLGSGNAALFNWHERSPSGGDNLFLCSLLA
ncbi:MAG: PQQ-binding-like beta-propeller repeat protein, partial [Acidobacteriota bacterium]